MIRYRQGMTKRVIKVATKSPQIMVLAMGAQVSDSPPNPIPIGKSPQIVVIEVRRIGRRRTRPESTTARDTMAIASAAFEPDGLIPAEYTCDGEDISPPLSWQGVPEAAQSLVVIVDDPDAPGGTFVHWVMYGLSSDVAALPAAVPPAAELEEGRRQGKNDFGNLGYGGPCPPRGIHRYVFKVYALDKSLALEAGASKRQVLEAISGQVLAGGKLVGRYGRD